MLIARKIRADSMFLNKVKVRRFNRGSSSRGKGLSESGLKGRFF
jgi:hypothetical protein